ncbi:MAG: Holliday junction resolvase RuvX [Candidatus Shapirobacteria bacterium]|nr:Holliday junction resolvase RuvX [Candidatus Shapirobacteria bacterium]
MNILAIDYGTKRIGLAVSIMGIISPIESVKNNSDFITILKKIIEENRIEKIYVGISDGPIVSKIKEFVKDLSSVLQLPVETVDEAVSTIEANEIFVQNKKKDKKFKASIDSIAAAVILRRVIES